MKRSHQVFLLSIIENLHYKKGKFKMNNNEAWIENLKHWAIENPIKYIETLKNDLYKNFDGYVGLPDDENEYLSIDKLILPLGDTYEKDILKELASLPNLTELTLIARNVKEVPSEIFHIPTLKMLSITVDYTFQISEQDLKALIANKCQEISVGNINMSTRYKDNIKDEAILNYVSKQNLYITSQDFGIPKNDLYKIAKKIAFTDTDVSEYILDFLEENHILGYKAFIHAHNNDEKKIDTVINYIDLEYELYDEVGKYVKCVLEVGFSIVDAFPLKALEIINNMNEAYTILGHLPQKSMNLSVDIVCSIAKQDVAKALGYLDIIEVEYYRLEALEKIRQYPQSKEIADKLDEIIVELKNVVDSFDSKESLTKKVATKEEVSKLLAVARVDSIEALAFFKKCNYAFYYDLQAIHKVIAYIKEDSLQEALTIIRNLKDNSTKQIALSDLALHAQAYDLDFSLQVVNLCDSHYKPRTQADIAHKILKSDIKVAEQIANAIDDTSYRVGALAAIASHKEDDDTIYRLINVSIMPKVCDDNKDYHHLLYNIATNIADNFPDKAIELLKEIHTNKPVAIMDVALSLMDTDLGIELIKNSLDDDGAPWHSFALEDMALKIAKTDMQKALTLIDEIQDEEVKEDALFWLNEEY